MTIRPLGRLWGAVVCSCLWLGACGPPDTVEIDVRRSPRTEAPPARVDATSAQRFGGERPKTLVYAVPEGWQERARAQFRDVNLIAGTSSQCYVTKLTGVAGGLLDNVNRWYGQFGAQPLTPAQLAELPTVEFLGESCPLVELTGPFAGMGAAPGEDQTLYATLLIRPAGSVFVKMVGPSDEMAQHRDGFLAFVASLREEEG